MYGLIRFLSFLILFSCNNAFEWSLRQTNGFKEKYGCSRLLATNDISNTNVKKPKVEKLLKDTDYIRTPTAHEFSINDDPLIPFVETIVLAADNRKATSISALRVSHLTEITSFMVIIEGKSTPQNQAISLSIEEDIEVQFGRLPSRQGDAPSGWVILDYGSVLVHVMTPQMRAFYKLEKRWKGAEPLDVEELVARSAARTMSSRGSGGEVGSIPSSDKSLDAVEEEDPFWS